jgi:hypothetical protein
MRHLSLQALGALAIFVAIIRGAIAELRMFPQGGYRWRFVDRNARARLRDRPDPDSHG